MRYSGAEADVDATYIHGDVLQVHLTDGRRCVLDLLDAYQRCSTLVGGVMHEERWARIGTELISHNILIDYF